MISRIIKKTVDLSKIQKVDQLEGPLYQLENGGHTFEITCLMDGAAASVSGTVSARFLRADEETVYFTGTLTGNVASITLPQSCYNVNGRFGLVVFVAGNDITSAIYAVAGSVYRSTSDHIIDPTEEIPSLEDLIAKIGECEEATADAQQAASFVPSIIASTYSTSVVYAVGDYCTYEGALYRCTAETDGAFDPADWEAVKVGTELENVDAEIDDLKSAFQNHEMVITPFVNNSYVDRDGNITNYTGWNRTDYLNIEKAESIAVVSSRQSTYNCFFDANKNFIAAFTVGTTVKNISVPFGAVYVIFSNTNAGMDTLVVKENTMSDAKIQIALDSATKQFNANNLDFVQGIYSSTGVINSSYAKAVNADIPSNSVYITNQYDGYYYFAVWDSGGTYVGAFFFSGFAASGSSGTYYENIANIKPIFEQYPDATVKIVYIARDANDVLINTEDFNTLFTLYVHDEESGSGIDPEVLVENTITGVYNDVDIDSKIAEYGALLVDSGKADTFLFFTDPHPFYTASTSGTLSDGWKDGINRRMPIVGKAYHSTGTAFCLCGGDWLGNTDTPAVACTKLGYVNGIMKNMFDRFYMLNGNHDVNEQGTEVLTGNALINTMFSRTGKAYQAFKAANAKFYLFDTGAVFPSTMSSYRWEQIDWFGEGLLADDDANNVIGLHIVTNQYKDSFESNPVFQTFATNIMAMAEAYNAKTTITMNEKTYDFTGTTGKVRFAIAGHSHFDAITTLHNIPIMITNWIRAGSVSTFDLVLADYENGVVKTVRIGSGSNRTMAMA